MDVLDGTISLFSQYPKTKATALKPIKYFAGTNAGGWTLSIETASFNNDLSQFTNTAAAGDVLVESGGGVAGGNYYINGLHVGFYLI